MSRNITSFMAVATALAASPYHVIPARVTTERERLLSELRRCGVAEASVLEIARVTGMSFETAAGHAIAAVECGSSLLELPAPRPKTQPMAPKPLHRLRSTEHRGTQKARRQQRAAVKRRRGW